MIPGMSALSKDGLGQRLLGLRVTRAAKGMGGNIWCCPATGRSLPVLFCGTQDEQKFLFLRVVAMGLGSVETISG